MKPKWEKALSRAVFDEFLNRGVIIAGVGENNVGAALAEGFHFLGSKVTAIGYDQESLDKLSIRLDKKGIPDSHPLQTMATDLMNEAERSSAMERACSVCPPRRLYQYFRQ